MSAYYWWLQWLPVTFSMLPGLSTSAHAEHYFTFAAQDSGPSLWNHWWLGVPWDNLPEQVGPPAHWGKSGFREGEPQTNKLQLTQGRRCCFGMFIILHPLAVFSAISQLCMIRVRANALQALQPAGLYGLHFQSLWEKPSGWTICVSPGFSLLVQPLAIICSQCRISQYSCDHGRSWKQSGIVTYRLITYSFFILMFLLCILYTNEPSKFWTWSSPSKLWHLLRPWPELHWAYSSADCGDDVVQGSVSGKQFSWACFPINRWTSKKCIKKHFEFMSSWSTCSLRPESQIRHFIDSADVGETWSDVSCGTMENSSKLFQTLPSSFGINRELKRSTGEGCTFKGLVIDLAAIW